MLNIVGDKVWLLVGCSDTRMEGTLLEYYHENSWSYNGDRVFRNYSGLRPSEPTSAAIVATFHTLTFLMLYLFRKVNEANSLEVSSITEDKSFEVPFIDCIFTNNCLDDLRALAETSLLESACEIVGHDPYGAPNESATNKQLVTQGKRWAVHINEPWQITVIIGCYIIVSVGLNVTIVRVIADVLVAILALCGLPMDGKLAFGYNYLATMRSQAIAWTAMGLVVQLLDALVFVYLAKLLTPLHRVMGGRPLWARLGKRTLVVVDVPWVHQLVHQFVSKLFSESYSFVSIDVHGADGRDNFVHCYTHRVVRGLLIAVGRPDGRLHGLGSFWTGFVCVIYFLSSDNASSLSAKYESAVLLSSKQAAFIRNPRYNHESAGPEFVTVGHNSFQPSMGLASHIVLPRKKGKFIDEVLYDSLSSETASSNCDSEHILSLVRSLGADAPVSKSIYGKHFFDKKAKSKPHKQDLETLYHTIKEFLDFSRHGHRDRNDPAMRMSFSSRLDNVGQTIEAHNAHLHVFYERRVASLERFVAFCVMFHAMAEDCKAPWLCGGWNTARSQSNLRVATTG